MATVSGSNVNGGIRRGQASANLLRAHADKFLCGTRRAVAPSMRPRRRCVLTLVALAFAFGAACSRPPSGPGAAGTPSAPQPTLAPPPTVAPTAEPTSVAAQASQPVPTPNPQQQAFGT